ncbi:SDR family NAD(P)-dependent oxidoreductase [Shimia sp. R9_3]|uniref:SDR family NAD(P)-dependent oxidoreductase n=1 Tax=Shimia sp. R9_3 TaxID=2821113 RepID=UPI001ADD2381|nr:SDR family NAD(P)-dependent oxidoreductase [Shimia sp. R9_3]MBO9400717.1 SDR family NAD(P)-dependent oxidoreductase [Shimia sp. R9_3]
MSEPRGGGRKTAVISGGGGGLGSALSKQLQEQGWQVVLLDREVSGLQISDTQLPMKCDLTDPAQLAACCEKILACFERIDLVVYAAGVTTIGPVAKLSDLAHRHLFEVNYFAAVALAQAFQKALRLSQGAHLVLTSVAGFAPLYQRAAYAASKHAMAGFFGSLRAEERAFGVRVCVAAPSFVATNPEGRIDALGISPPGSAADAVDAMTPEQAATEILRGFRQGRDFVAVGRVSKLAHMLNRVSPAFYQWLMARTIKGEAGEAADREA